MSLKRGLASPQAERPELQGFLAALAAYIIWGFSPVFFHSLAALSPLEVVAHRVVWGLISVGVFIVAMGRLPEVLTILRQPRKLAAFAGSALAITINWVVFVHAATTGQGLAASLGYYIFPLVTVALAALVLKERFTRRQGLALGVVIAGVALLIVGTGNLPWITMTLALSFGSYGLLRKIAPAESLVGLFVETLILTPFALGFLIYQHVTGQGLTHLAEPGWLWPLLIIGTPIWTALPLFLFAFAARRLRLSTVGLMQYLNPTCQFVLAVLFFGETLTPLHLAVFGTIWLGIAIYAVPSKGVGRG